MNHRRRILADRLIAFPTALLFNAFARAIGKLMRRDHSITPVNVKKIVVAKLIGMGSILQATPLLKALKGRFPQAQLTFVTMRSNQELLKHLSCIDEVLILDDQNVFRMALTTLQTIAALIRQRADLYLDLEVYSAFSSLLALWAVTRNRIGFYRHSAFFKKEASLGIYAGLIGVRQMMELRPVLYKCAVFFNVPAFLIFVVLIYRIIRWACRSLDIQNGDFVAGSMLAVEAALLFVLFFPKPQMLPTRFTSEYGSFYTQTDVATLFPQIVFFYEVSYAERKKHSDFAGTSEPVCFRGNGSSYQMVFSDTGICGAGTGARVHQ
jgi:hypothetical protein